MTDNEQDRHALPTPRSSLFWIVTSVAILIGLACAAGGVGLVMAARERDKEAAAKPAPSVPRVDVEVLREVRLPRLVETTGFLRSPSSARISVETQGRLLEKKVSVGDRVEAGALLALIDDRLHQKTLEAGTARAKSLETQLAFFDKELARERSLAERGSGRPADLDRLTSEKDRLVAAVAENEASLSQSRLLLEKCEVRADRGGVWYEDLAEVGEFLAPGQPIGTLREVDELELPVEVSGAVRLALSVGQEVEVDVLDADPQLIASGAEVEGARVAELPVGADPLTRRFPVVISLSNAAGRWIPGLFARARLRLDSMESALLVPKQAVVTRLGKSAIFVAEQDEEGVLRARLRFVELRSIEDRPESWSATEGLQAGERLIVAPIERLRPDVEVSLESDE